MNVEAALLTRVGDGADIPWRDSLARFLGEYALLRCCGLFRWALTYVKVVPPVRSARSLPSFCWGPGHEYQRAGLRLERRELPFTPGRYCSLVAVNCALRVSCPDWFLRKPNQWHVPINVSK
jgi:hypothetical protein